MIIVKTADSGRALLLGIFVAALSFSWALATTPDATSKNFSASSRQVGSNLRISNPLLAPGQDPQFPNGGDFANDPDVFDLGEACLGSQFVRYLSGLGGVTPYVFTSSPAGSNGAAANIGLTLDPSGRVSGAVPVSGPSPASFDATLTDAAGRTRAGIFRVGTRTCLPGDFRFAVSRLPEGQVGQDYITRVEVLNQTTSTVFSVVAGSVLFNGGTISGLEFMGLSLFQDGTLAGRPLASGTVAFTARATKNGQTTDQVLSISISPETRVQSVLAVTKISVKGTTGLPLSTIDVSAVLNTNGQRNLDLRNKRFVLRFAGATFATTLDGSAQSTQRDFRIKLLAPDGLLRVQIRNADFIAALNDTSLVHRGQFTGVLEIEIGETFLGTEAVQFDVRNRRGKYNIHYRLGKERQLGGLFQVLALDAADFSGGTAYKFNFLISHVKGRSEIEFGSPSQATVFIGQGFQQTVALKRGRGVFAPEGLRSVKITTQRKQGQITTYPLPASQTGIVPASQASNPQDFLFGIDVDTTSTFFSGDSSRVIFPFVR